MKFHLGSRKEIQFLSLCAIPANGSLQSYRCIKSRMYSRDGKILLFVLPSTDHVFNSWALLRPSLITIPIKLPSLQTHKTTKCLAWFGTTVFSKSRYSFCSNLLAFKGNALPLNIFHALTSIAQKFHIQVQSCMVHQSEWESQFYHREQILYRCCQTLQSEHFLLHFFFNFLP